MSLITVDLYLSCSIEEDAEFIKDLFLSLECLAIQSSLRWRKHTQRKERARELTIEEKAREDKYMDGDIRIAFNRMIHSYDNISDYTRIYMYHVIILQAKLTCTKHLAITVL